MAKPHLICLSGAGMSAESGIKTFRDSNGLWEDHDILDVATPEAWQRNSDLVNKFYNARRAQLLEVNPNAGHLALAQLEACFRVSIITQNVDDLHERAGSSHVVHLHGELKKVRSCVNPNFIVDWTKDLTATDLCPQKEALRPHIVWFGEPVPAIEEAANLIQRADIVIVVGTSMQVYPASGLIGLAPEDAEIIYIDPFPSINYELSLRQNLRIIESTAARALPQFAAQHCP